MAIRKNKLDGTWGVDIRIQGKRIRLGGFLSKDIAEAWILQKKLKAQKGAAGLDVNDDIEIDEIFSKYLEHSSQYKKPKSAKREASALGNWRKYFSEHSILYACEISDQVAQKFIAWRKFFFTCRGQEVSTRTINIDIEVLERCLAWAVEGKILSRLPARMPQKFRQKRPGLPRYFSLTEIETISRMAMSDTKKTMLWAAFQVLIRTGIRAGELCELRIADIDFPRNALIIRPEISKAGRLRIVPFDEKSKEILGSLIEEAQKRGRDYLFSTRSGERQTVDNLTRRFRGILKNAGIEGANLHTCRKTYISWKIMSGCDPVKVMAWAGHEEWATMKRYMALSQKYLEGTEAMPY